MGSVLAGGENDSEKRPAPASRLLHRANSLAQAFTVILIAATLATGLARYHWLADLLANLRVQQELALAGVLGFFLVTAQWRWCLAVVLMIGLHASWLVTALPSPASVQGPASAFRVTLANVLRRNDWHQEIADHVAGQNADVIVILELSSALADKLSRDLARSHPHQILHPQDSGDFGIGLFSAHPINDPKVFVVDESIGILSLEATISGYQVLATHPLPPMSGRGFAARNHHLEKIAARIEKTRRRLPDRPVVLVGDLNVTPWSPHFDNFQRSSGLRRAIDAVNLAPTWYAFDWFVCGLVLDHIMISPQIQCAGHSVGPDIGSDHRSVTVDLLSE